MPRESVKTWPSSLFHVYTNIIKTCVNRLLLFHACYQSRTHSLSKKEREERKKHSLRDINRIWHLELSSVWLRALTHCHYWQWIQYQSVPFSLAQNRSTNPTTSNIQQMSSCKLILWMRAPFKLPLPLFSPFPWLPLPSPPPWLFHLSCF